MSASRFQFVWLSFLIAAGFVYRAGFPGLMAIEHFDEGVYASGHFSPQLNFRYPDLPLYAPPLFPAVLDWMLVLAGSRPHAVMWVNIILGTLLIPAVWWTTRELCGLSFELSAVSAQRSAKSDQRSAVSGQQSTIRDRTFPSTFNLQPSTAIAAPLAAAALVAFHDMFIQYSRAALTDIPVCLGIVLAVGAGCRALRTGSWLWTLNAGLLTSAAWWTKYNGWLPLAILTSGAVGRLVVEWTVARWFTSPALPSDLPPPENRAAKKARKNAEKAAAKSTSSVPGRPGLLRLALQLGTISLIAWLLWRPYLQQLAPDGGYAPIAENHAGYLVGWSGWWNSALRHFAVSAWSSSRTTMIGNFLAIFLAGSVFTWNSGVLVRTHLSRVTEYLAYLIALFTLGITLLCGSWPLLLVGVVPWLVLSVAEWKRRPFAANLGFMLLLAWVTGLTLATPLYRPYPRLILPWLLGVSIASAGGWSLLFRWWYERLLAMPKGDLPEALGVVAGTPSEVPPSPPIPGWRPAIALAVMLLFVSRDTVWEDRTGLKTAAGEVLSVIERDLGERSVPSAAPGPCIIYVLAEPGLYFHLASASPTGLEFIAQPASGLAVLQRRGEVDVPVYILTSLHAREESEELATMPDRVALVATVPWRASDLALLDEFPPSAVEENRDQTVQVWRVRP